MISHERLEQFW